MNDLDRHDMEFLKAVATAARDAGYEGGMQAARETLASYFRGHPDLGAGPESAAVPGAAPRIPAVECARMVAEIELEGLDVDAVATRHGLPRSLVMQELPAYLERLARWLTNPSRHRALFALAGVAVLLSGLHLRLD